MTPKGHNSDTLTPTQTAAYGVVCALRSREGISPSLAEIALALKVTPATARMTLKRLARKGYIGLKPGKYRSITVLKKMWEAA